ncbi:MAG: dihydrodipicolinate reductase [Bacilli bacterium]
MKIVQYGCGKMAHYIMRYIIENGEEIVGAIDKNINLIGKDIGEILESDIKGIKITDPSMTADLFKQTKPDICIITSMSLMKDVKEIFLLCASMGINAISTCEEAFYPFNSSPKLTAKIDHLAKQNNCTITGSGYQEANWGLLVATLAGTTHKITKIIGKSSYNVEDYGIALARAHGAGKTKEQFNQEIASTDNISDIKRQKLINEGTFLPSYMWSVNGWLCDKLNLTVVKQTQKCVPQICKEDIFSNTLNMTIKKGVVVGMSALVTTTTKEGIILETECIGKVYNKDEYDCNAWTIIGEPTTSLTINKPCTVELTCAAIVNRLTDVIKAPAGFIPTSKMGELKYIKK